MVSGQTQEVSGEGGTRAIQASWAPGGAGLRAVWTHLLGLCTLSPPSPSKDSFPGPRLTIQEGFFPGSVLPADIRGPHAAALWVTPATASQTLETPASSLPP